MTTAINPTLSPAIQLSDIEILSKKSNEWLTNFATENASNARLIVNTNTLFARVSNPQAVKTKAANSLPIVVKTKKHKEVSKDQTHSKNCRIM